MPTIEERVSHLEGQMNGVSRTVEDIRNVVASVDRRMDARFEAVDRRFEAVDRRFDVIDRRLDGLDTKMSRHFLWLVGVQVTTLTAIIAALLAA